MIKMTRSEMVVGIGRRFMLNLLVAFSITTGFVHGFISSESHYRRAFHVRHNVHVGSDESNDVTIVQDSNNNARRDFLNKMTLCVVGVMSYGEISSAAVGTLPEFADTNTILQGLSVKVADKSQQDAMVTFLQDSFDFKVLRQRIAGSVTETWMGFGPEELSIPSEFIIPVSSFAMYGGHASIRIVYDEKAADVFYRQGEPAPGDNIAFLQLGVPTYRISQMVKNGGNVLDAYGFVNVVAPCGLPMRAIVGISPDPIMFIAINCQDIKQSTQFYEQLGFVEQEYPYARLSKGTSQFEPPQPKNSVYLAPSAFGMGVLLLQSPKRRSLTPNPALDSLHIVYSPSGKAADVDIDAMLDPSGISVAFQSVEKFEKEEKQTR